MPSIFLQLSFLLFLLDIISHREIKLIHSISTPILLSFFLSIVRGARNGRTKYQRMESGLLRSTTPKHKGRILIGGLKNIKGRDLWAFKTPHRPPLTPDVDNNHLVLVGTGTAQWTFTVFVHCHRA